MSVVTEAGCPAFLADANLRFRQDRMMRRSSPPRCVILHHAGERSASVQAVHQYHLSKEWAGIGYHFYITKDGRIWKGRPVEYVGAHAGGHNADSIAICVEGDFDQERMTMTQYMPLLLLLTYLIAQYGPLSILRHRDVGNTSCPGRLFPIGKGG